MAKILIDLSEIELYKNRGFMEPLEIAKVKVQIKTRDSNGNLMIVNAKGHISTDTFRLALTPPIRHYCHEFNRDSDPIMFIEQSNYIDLKLECKIVQTPGQEATITVI